MPNKKNTTVSSKHAKPVTYGVCLLAFLFAGFFYCFRSGEDNQVVVNTAEPALAEETNEAVTEETTETIWVHICGQVVNPGVYEIPADARIYELLSLAGGATEEGVPDTINLARQMKDGERILIPARGEEELSPKEEEGAGLVNINRAGKDRLMSLPGIGEAKAADIISYREEHGDFQSIEDIMKITGIKDALFQKIKNYIEV